MLNLKSKIPVKEDCIKQMQVLIAQTRDLLNEQETLLSLLVQSDTLWSLEDTANYLRCDPKKVPRAIPRIKINNRVIRFKKADIDAFVESKMIR